MDICYYCGRALDCWETRLCGNCRWLKRNLSQ